MSCRLELNSHSLVGLCLEVISYLLLNVRSSNDTEGAVTSRPNLRRDAIDDDALRPSPTPWPCIVRLAFLQPLVDKRKFVLLVTVILLEVKEELPIQFLLPTLSTWRFMFHNNPKTQGNPTQCLLRYSQPIKRQNHQRPCRNTCMSPYEMPLWKKRPSGKSKLPKHKKLHLESTCCLLA